MGEATRTKRGQWSITLGGLALLVLLAGCLSRGSVGRSPSSGTAPTNGPLPSTTGGETPTPSPTSTASPSSSTAHCVNGVSFYGLDSPGETAWSSDRVAIGYTVPANASVFFVAFEEGNVIGTTHVTTQDRGHGVTADGDVIPLDRPASGSHMIRVGAYADTNDNGRFESGTDQACRSDGHPVEAGPRRINFSTFGSCRTRARIAWPPRSATVLSTRFVLPAGRRPTVQRSGSQGF